MRAPQLLLFWLKFIYSKKTTKFCEIFTVDLFQARLWACGRGNKFWQPP